MAVRVELGKKSYDVLLEPGLLKRAGELLELSRRALIVTDSGVPAEYAQTVAAQCACPRIVTVPQGEQSKSMANFELLCREMLRHDMSRSDCVVAVGGGVVGDLAGFAAASFMRGIDFYNIPTTVLSQVDSSIGGKVAVDMDGIKNCVGAFHQPKRVLVDTQVLSTLPERHISNGLAESVKMALTFDEELFRRIEQGNPLEDIQHIIHRSLELKAWVVQQDETEQGLRRVLNFGHTIGHGIESQQGLGGLLHGECVGLGMLCMCASDVRERLISVLRKLNLPAELRFPVEEVWQAMSHDKKKIGGSFKTIYVPRVGSYEIRDMSEQELYGHLKEVLS